LVNQIMSDPSLYEIVTLDSPPATRFPQSVMTAPAY